MEAPSVKTIAISHQEAIDGPFQEVHERWKEAASKKSDCADGCHFCTSADADTDPSNGKSQPIPALSMDAADEADVTVWTSANG